MQRPGLDALARALDNNINARAGAKLKFRRAGTDDPQAVFSSPALNTSLGATLTADSAGKFPPFWFDPTLDYDARYETSAGVLIELLEDVSVSNDNEILTEEFSFVAVADQVQFTLTGVHVTEASAVLVFNLGVRVATSDYELEIVGDDTVLTVSDPCASGAQVHVVVLGGNTISRQQASSLVSIMDDIQTLADLATAGFLAVGIRQAYSTATTDADPGAGVFRFNNTTIASATAAYVDNADAGGGSVAALLDTFDDSSSTAKGHLLFRGAQTPTAFAVFAVTGSVIDGTGYRKLTLSHVASGGTWTNGETFTWIFVRTGDKGDQGPTGAAGAGSGDVVAANNMSEYTGSASAALGNLGFSANGTSLVQAANYAAMRALLDLEAGTDFNAYSSKLAGIAASSGISGTVTVSTSTPSGGADGDLWLQYTP